ncbi:MAG: putative secreted hydrolase [Granulosicoccus sp.]|jgi:predicted secreted hydrolase
MASDNIRRLSLCGAFLGAVSFAFACDTGTSASQPSNSQDPGQDPEQNSEVDWRRLLDSLPVVETPLSPVVMPADLRSHAEQTGESFEARWAMTSAKGQSFTAFAQLDRLKLKENVDSRSSWSYNSVARANVATGSSDDYVLDVHEVFSRVALGLSDSRGDEFIVGSTSLSLGQSDSCKRNLEFLHHDNQAATFTLSAKADRCPQSVSLGTINQWEFDGIPAVGLLAGEKVEGVLWLSHRWGTAANLQSAVVLDQLRLVVRNSVGISQWLSVTRSKRLSGRGPKTVLATVRDDKGDKRDAIVEWFDHGEVISSATGNVYPETIRIQELSVGMDIVLSPVVRLSEIRDSLQTRWSGALDVSGSHTGLAYLDFLPITQKETN